MLWFKLFLLKIFVGKEIDIMAVWYATLIVKGRKTLDQVHEILREQVRQILSDLEIEY